MDRYRLYLYVLAGCIIGAIAAASAPGLGVAVGIACGAGVGVALGSRSSCRPARVSGHRRTDAARKPHDA